MNNYKFEDIKIGMEEQFEVIVTKEMQQKFKEISGDINPMHADKNFANEKGFNDVLVYGMLTASFFSKLVGVYLPGKNCLFQECSNIRFHAPVFINDKLSVCGQVIEIDERFKRITIKAIIKNKENKKVCSAKLIAGVL